MMRNEKKLRAVIRHVLKENDAAWQRRGDLEDVAGEISALAEDVLMNTTDIDNLGMGLDRLANLTVEDMDTEMQAEADRLVDAVTKLRDALTYLGHWGWLVV